MTNHLSEVGNKEIIDKLATISYSGFLNVVKQSEWKFEVEDNELEENYREQYTMIKNYCMRMKENNYVLNVEYNHSPKQPTGRVYARQGIQPLWGMFRGAICGDKYYDFDMVCAHNSILLYICKKNKIECRRLEEYVERRDITLNDFCDNENIKRREAKQLFITSLYDENKRLKLENKAKIKSQFYLQYDEEIKRIQRELPKFYKKEWKEIKRKNHNDDNTYGKLVSNICCELENKILQEVIKLTTPNVLMYDGFMVDRDKIKNPEKFVKELNNKTKHYKIKWSEKEMDTSVYETILYLDKEECLSIVADTIDEISDELHKTLLLNKIYRCNDVYYYNNGIKWVIGRGFAVKDYIYVELFSLITNHLDIWIYDPEKAESIKLKTSMKYIEDLIKYIYLNSPRDNEFVARVWDWTRDKLYFKNGYWDFTNETFNLPDGNTFYVIERDYENKSNPDVRKEIYDKVLNPIFTCYEERDDYTERCRLRDYFLYYVSRSAGGAVGDKVWGMLTGERNCGKSLLIDFIKNSFGSYCGVSSGEQLVYQQTMGDVAKKMSWLLPYEFKRFILMSELPIAPNKGNAMFDGNKIKMITSGGDEIEVRKNYTDEQNIRIQATLLCAFNDEPECCPTDALKTSKCFNFISKFVGDGEETKFKNIKYIKKDDKVKDVFIKRKDVVNEFVSMITECYNNKKQYPHSLQVSRDLDNETDVDKLLNYFVFTDNKKDFISNKLIGDLLKKIHSPFKMKKAKDYLKGFTNKNIETTFNNERGLTHIQYKAVIESQL